MHLALWKLSAIFYRAENPDASDVIYCADYVIS